MQLFSEHWLHLFPVHPFRAPDLAPSLVGVHVVPFFGLMMSFFRTLFLFCDFLFSLLSTKFHHILLITFSHFCNILFTPKTRKCETNYLK